MAEITTIISKEAIAPGPKTSPSNHTAWLEQLESAQWQQRLRYQPQPDQRQPGRAATSQQQSAPAAPFAHGAADMSQQLHASNRAETGPHTVDSHARTEEGSTASASPALESPAGSGPGLPVLRQT